MKIRFQTLNASVIDADLKRNGGEGLNSLILSEEIKWLNDIESENWELFLLCLEIVWQLIERK